MVLFGSRARGDAREDSDYDVAVFLRDLSDRWHELDRLADLRTDFLEDADVFIDVKPYPAGGYPRPHDLDAGDPSRGRRPLTPEIGEHLDKARECSRRARIILGAGVGEDAGRDAYLAGFHAAQALILARSGKVVKTDRGVHRLFSQLARTEPQLREFSRFLSQAYNLKDIADYELGPDAAVALDRASAAITIAERFLDRIAEILA